MKYILNKDSFLLLEFIDNAKQILLDNNVDLNNEMFLRLKQVTKSNPSYIGLLTHYVFNLNENIDEVIRVFDLIKKYSQLLKNNNINPIEMVDYNEYSQISNYSDKIKNIIKSNKKIYRYFFLEELEDVIREVIIENDKKKFVKKFISNKYKHLVNDKTIELFYELKNLGEKFKWDNLHKKIQSLLTDKLIIFKTPEDLNSALEKVIEQIKGGWNTDAISEMIIGSGATVVHKDDRFVIADTNQDNDVVCELGSPKWCIVYSKAQFNHYLEFPNKQYIVYDTYLDRTDNKSMIGVTIKFNQNELGKFFTAHDRADSFVSEDYFKGLGIRKYLKRMDLDEIKSHSDKFTFKEKIKYHLNDELIADLEDGLIDTETYSEEIVKLLLTYSNLEVFKFFYGNFEPNINKVEYLSLAVSDPKILEYLLNNMDPNFIESYGKRPLLQAINLDKLESVKLLIKYGVDTKIDIYSPVALAVKTKNLQLVKFLVENGLDPSDNNNRAIKTAFDNKYKEIVNYLYNQDSVKNKLNDVQINRIEKFLNK